VDAATADATSDERKGRRRRRRRGRGGRDAESGVGLDGTELEADETTADAAPAMMPVEPAEPAAVTAPAPQADAAHAGNGSAIPEKPAVAMVAPHMVVVPPTFSPPAVEPSPMPVEQLQSVLELAGLTLVQTEPVKLEEVRMRIASEPRPVRAPRERPALAPLDTGPLIQVETRQAPTSAP
jgi:ribonuclease E